MFSPPDGGLAVLLTAVWYLFAVRTLSADWLACHSRGQLHDKIQFALGCIAALAFPGCLRLVISPAISFWGNPLDQWVCGGCVCVFSQVMFARWALRQTFSDHSSNLQAPAAQTLSVQPKTEPEEGDAVSRSAVTRREVLLNPRLMAVSVLKLVVAARNRAAAASSRLIPGREAE